MAPTATSDAGSICTTLTTDSCGIRWPRLNDNTRDFWFSDDEPIKLGMQPETPSAAHITWQLTRQHYRKLAESQSSNVPYMVALSSAAIVIAIQMFIHRTCRKCCRRNSIRYILCIERDPPSSSSPLTNPSRTRRFYGVEHGRSSSPLSLTSRSQPPRPMGSATNPGRSARYGDPRNPLD